MANHFFNIAIVDDESGSRKIISRLLQEQFTKMDSEVSINTFPNAKLFYQSLEKSTYDIIFLDIEMPEINGIALAKKLNSEKKNQKIVFVSNREDLVFESLETRPFGFVRKSNFQRDINIILTSFLNEISKDTDKYLVISSEGRQINLELKNIVYIESQKRNQLIHVSNLATPYITSVTFQSMEDYLESKGFILCFRGILVNYQYIEIINDDCIDLKEGKTIPMSRRLAVETKKKYMELVKDHMMTIC